jgi:hypothetical protein
VNPEIEERWTMQRPDTKRKVIKHVAKALSLSYKLCLNVRLDSLLCTFTFISILSRTTIKALFLYFNLFGVMLGSISYPCTLLILPRHLRSPHVYSGIRVVRSLVFYVVLYRFYCCSRKNGYECKCT